MARRRDMRLLAVAALAGGTLLGGALLTLVPDRGRVIETPAAPAPPDPAPQASPAEAPDARPVTDTGPTDPAMRRFDSHFRAAVMLLQAGQAMEAAVMLEEARRLRPHVPAVFVNLGFAYLGMNEPERGVEAFNKALDLNPTQINAYFGLAESLERLGDIPGALGAMRTFVHRTPEDDPFRRRAMSAIWEWEARQAAVAGAAPPEPEPKPEGQP